MLDDLVADFVQRLGGVGAYDGIVFNDGDAAGHVNYCVDAAEYTAIVGQIRPRLAAAFLLPQLISALPESRPRRASVASFNASCAHFQERR